MKHYDQLKTSLGKAWFSENEEAVLMGALINDYHQYGAWIMAMNFFKLGKMRASGKITKADMIAIANELEAANRSPFSKR